MPSSFGLSTALERRLQVVARQLEASSTPEAGLVTANYTNSRDGTSTPKICSAAEAAQGLQDGDVVTVAGFVGSSCPDLLLKAVRERFDESQHPQKLTLLYVASAADGKAAGLNRLGVEGLVSKLIYGWTGSAPQLVRLVQQDKVQAWNLPLGVVSHMIRDVAAGRLGPITHIGLGTFVDPRAKGGRLNAVTQEDIVEVVRVGGRDRLWYKAPRAINVALLRGTTADMNGNVSFEKEPLYLDQLYQAMAAHNSGGTVIVQVERVVAAGSIPSRLVHLPGALVDKVVVATPDLHPMSFTSPLHDGCLTGEVMAPQEHMDVLPLSVRRVIAHRAMLAIGGHCKIVNLGVGMPEGVAAMLASHAHHNPAAAGVQLTVEAGTFGGMPLSGNQFGTTRNATAYIPTATMLDFYNGGGLDLAVLGMAQVDTSGNVNVSRFGSRMPGCGGFIDISQTAKQVCFVGTFTTGGLKVDIQGGQLRILHEGRQRKFCAAVEEHTFVSSSSSSSGQTVLYITERAVFQLLCEGQKRAVELLEVAPGADLERDVLSQMDFRPVTRNVKQMDARLFEE